MSTDVGAALHLPSQQISSRVLTRADTHAPDRLIDADTTAPIESRRILLMFLLSGRRAPRRSGSVHRARRSVERRGRQGRARGWRTARGQR